MASRKRRSRFRRLIEKRLRARRAAAGRRRLELESLEPRVLLTTLVGGDIFEYIDADGQTIRIATTGDLIAEIIAADIDDQNQVFLGDMPGTFIGSVIGRLGHDVLGGRGGEDGVEPVTLDNLGGAPTPVTDADFLPLSIGRPFDGTDDIEFAAMASRDAANGGDTYGINFGTVPEFNGEDRDVIQLVQFDTPDTNDDDLITGNATVEAMIHQATLREDNFPATQFMGNIQAFAADPTAPGIAYALNTGGTLFQVSLVDGTVTTIGAVNNGGTTLTGVRAMGFDSTGQLHLLVRDFDNNNALDSSMEAIGLPTGNPPATPFSGFDVALLQVEKLTGSVTQIQTVFINGFETTVLYTGMAFLDDSTIYAIGRTFNQDGEPDQDQLHVITTNPLGLNVSGVNIGDTEQRFEGVAFARDISDNVMLVGIDHSQSDNGITQSRLGRIDINNANVAFISEAGMVTTVGDLTSVAESAGERPLLYATTGFSVIRGSAVALPTETDNGATAIGSVMGASFRPTTGDPEDGLLYFTAEGVAGNADPDRLYNVDVDETNRSRIQNSMRLIGTIGDGGDDNDVTALVWDRVGDSADLWAFQNGNGVDGTGRLIQLDPNFAFTVAVIDVTQADDNVTNITGLAFVADDPAITEEFFIAVAGEDLLRIRRTTGTTFTLGPLPDPDDITGEVRGEDLQDLTWNTELRNPFTGELGVLLATDATTDELVFVDHRPRFPTADAFAIYVSQAAENASIAIAVVPPFDPQNPNQDRDMQPFTGEVAFRVFPAQGGDLILASAAGTGGVLVGAKSEDVLQNVTDEDQRPLIAASMGLFFDEYGIGARPAGLDNLPDDLFNDLSAGINGAASIMEFLSTNPDLAQRMLGFNLDNVQGLAVSRDGRIVVVDSDGLDTNGQVIDGDEVATVDPITGQASFPIIIRDSATGLPLQNIQGLDFADLDFLGLESLYAILDTFNIQPALNAGELIESLSGETDHEFVALTSTADGLTLYAIARIPGVDGSLNTDDDNYELFQITRDVVTGQVTDLTRLGVITDQFGNHIIDLDSIGLNSQGLIYVAGWNQDAPAPNANVGGAITAGTLLSDLGLLLTAAGSDDFIINTVGGAQLTIDLDGGAPLTVGDVVNAINAQATTAGLAVTASLSASGRSIDIRDETVGVGTLSIINAVNSTSGTQLGLDGVDFNADGVIYGAPIANDDLGEDFNIQALAINRMDPSQMLAINSTGAVFELYSLARNDDGVTGFAPVGQIELGGTAVLDLRAFDGDSNGDFYAIGLPADELVPTEEVGPNPGDGDLLADFDVLALTVTPAGTAYFLYDTGGLIQMAQVVRDTDGSVVTVNELGAIQDQFGNSITDISGLSSDDLGNIFIVGFNESAPVPNVTVGTSIDVTTTLASLFGGTGVTFTPDGVSDIVIINRAGAAVTIDLDPLTDLTIQDVLDAINTDPNAMAAGITAEFNDSKTGINIVDASVGLGTLTVLDATGATSASQLGLIGFDTDNDGVVAGSNIATLGLGGAFDVVALTISADGSVGYAIVADDNDTIADVSDDSLQLWEVNRDADTDAVTSFTLVGTLTDANGNKILDVNAIDMNAAGQLFVIGFNGGAPIPAGNVGGDLGGDFEDPDGNPPITSDIVGLAITTNDDYFALQFNGAAYDLRQIVRDTSTGAVTAFNLIGQVQQGSNAILGLAALEADASGGLFGVGTLVGALLPTLNVGGTLNGNFDVEGLVVDPDNANQLWAIVNNGATLDLYSLTRSEVSGQVTSFSFQGQVSRSLNGGDFPETAVLGVRDVDINPADGQIYIVGYSADQLAPTQDLGGLGAGFSTLLDVLVGGDVGDVDADPNNRNVWFVYRSDNQFEDGSNAPDDEHTFSNAIGQISRTPLGGPVTGTGLAAPGATGAPIGDTWGNDYTKILGLEGVGGTLFFMASNDTTPVPAVNVGGNLGDVFDIRGMTIAADGGASQDGTAYAVHFNGSNFDLLQVNQDPANRAVTTVQVNGVMGGATPINFIQHLEADVVDTNTLYVIGSTAIGVGSPLSIFAVDATTGNILAEATLGISMGTGGVRFGLAQDPLNPDDFFTTRRQTSVLNPGVTDSVLQRITWTHTRDAGGQITAFGGAATLTDAAGAPAASAFRSRLDAAPPGTGRNVATFAMDFNRHGDLLLIDGDTGSAGRTMLWMNRDLTNGGLGAFSAGLLNNTWQASEAGAIESDMRDFATAVFHDPVTGLVSAESTGWTYTINPFGVDAPNQLWVSATEYLSVARTLEPNTGLDGVTPATGDPDEVVVTTSLGILTDADGNAIFDNLNDDFEFGRALAIDEDGTIFAVVRFDADGDGDHFDEPDTLITIGDPIAGRRVVTVLGELQFNYDDAGDGIIDTANQGARIVGMDFTNNGELIAIDDSAGVSNRVMLGLNVIDPTQSRQLTNPTLTAISDNLKGLTVDFFGRVYALEENSAPGVQERLFISPSDQYLLTIDVDPADLDDFNTGAFLTNPQVVAESIGVMSDGDAVSLQRPVTDLFTALSFFDAGGGNVILYGVQRDLAQDPAIGVTTTDRLVTIDWDNTDIAVPADQIEFFRVDGLVSAGAIQTVTGIGTSSPRFIEGMDFSRDGRLIALATASEGFLAGQQQISINLANPSLSAEITSFASAGGLVGLTSDETGKFFSIDQTTGLFDRLFESTNQLGLFEIAANGAATLRGGGLTNNGSPVTDKNEVRGLALDPDGLFLYGILRVDSDNDGVLDRDQLILINTSTGTATDLGVVRVAGELDSTEITSIEFNALGQLIGIDTSDTTLPGDRMILLNIDRVTPGLSAPALSTELTPDGSVDPGLRGLTADAQGRFYSINVDRDFDELWTTASQVYHLANTSSMIGDLTVALATSVGEIWNGPALTGGMVTDSFVGLAFDAPDMMTGIEALYAVRDTAAGQVLVTIALPTPDPTVPTTDDLDGFTLGDDLGELQLTTVGTIRLNGGPSDIHGMDFNRNGELIAINGDVGSNARTMALIDKLNPSGFSEFRSDQIVDPALAGVASDADGRFYSIHVTGATGLASELWISADQIFQLTPADTDGDTVADTVSAAPTQIVTRDHNGILVMTTAEWGPLAIDASGNFYVVIDDMPGTGGSDLAVLVNGVVTRLGPIQVNGVDRNIIAMDFTPGGGLVGIHDPNTASDDGDRLLVAVNVLDPTLSRDLTLVGDVGDDLQGIAVDSTGRFFSIGADPNGVSTNDFLLTSANAQQIFQIDISTGAVIAPITVTEIVMGSPVAVANSFTSMAFAPDNVRSMVLGTVAEDTLFAILREVTGDVLVTIDPATGVMTRLGLALDGMGNPMLVEALEFTMDGDLVGYDDSQGGRRLVAFTFNETTGNYDGNSVARTAVGQVASDLRGLTTDDTGRFFSVNATPSFDELWVSGNQFQTLSPSDLTPGGPNAVAVPGAVLTVDGVAVTDTLKGLAVTPNDIQIDAALEEGDTDVLVRFSIGSGAGTRIGPIRVLDPVTGVPTPVDIHAMEYNAAGALIAVDGQPGSTSRRLIVVNTVVPEQSTQLTPPGSISSNLVGYALDDLGFAFGIDTSTSPDRLLVSPGASATLAVLEVDPLTGNPTGQATGVGFLGQGQIVSVSAMAFAPNGPNGQRLFVIGNDVNDGSQNLYELDPTNGNIVRTVGAVVDPVTGDALTIGSMDFDQITGRLLAHDIFNGRLVDINPEFADVNGVVQVGLNVATEDGSLRPTVGAISFDPNVDSNADGEVDGRFLAIDNAMSLMLLPDESFFLTPESAVMMTIRGTTSDAAIGQDMDNVFIGGSVIGRIDWAGSIDTLYVGWVVTGNAAGEFEGSDPTFPKNVVFRGDLRSLVTTGTIGGQIGGTIDEPVYLTGVDMEIRGRVGQIHSIDGITGSLFVLNNEPAESMSVQDFVPTENEGRLRFAQDNEGLAFERFELVNGTNFFNDTFDTPQRLGASLDELTGETIIRVTGDLDNFSSANDDQDFYSVAMLAGQTVTVQLISNFGFMNVAVFDPEGRVIATDYSNIGTDLNQPFQFTADRAGEYRFMVAWQGQINPFLGRGGTVTVVDAQTPYELIIANAGDVAMGGLVANNHIYNARFDTSYRVQRGDLGAIAAGGTFLVELAIPGAITNILVDEGNLRSIAAGDIGFGDIGAFNGDTNPTMVVGGSVGQLRSTAGILRIGSAIIGGDLQNVDAATDFYIVMEADGGIGNVRAGLMDSVGTFSVIQLNADGIGFDGTIDLIDVAGDMVAPEIHTGEGGNVRFIRVGGNIRQAGVFGGGLPDGVITSPGGLEELGFEGSGVFTTIDPESITFTDDSGANITLTPGLLGIEDTDILGNPVNNHFLTVRTFGIASGGVVVVDVRTTGGLVVNGNASPGGIGGEISSITSVATGREVLIDPDTGEFILEDEDDAVGGLPLGLVSIIIDGNAPIDVMTIDGAPVQQGATTGTNFFEIRNRSGGDILDVNANTIFTIATPGSIGVTSNGTGAIVNPISQVANVYPFNDQRTAIRAASHIVEISAGEAVGNVLALGDIGSVIANRDGVDNPDVFEGIAGPVVTLGTAAGSFGNIGFVNIGEGIAHSGSGNVSRAGIYAEGDIGLVVNQGRGSDVRGDIVANGIIESINLNHGSIINANIGSVSTFDQMMEFNQEFGSFDSPPAIDPDNPNLPPVEVIELGSVNLSGVGGIIGSFFIAADMGNFRADGFGILNSSFSVLGDGVYGNFTAGGFGLRSVSIFGGASIGDITATGRGDHLDVLDFGESVRMSENNAFDANFGLMPSSLTDLHRFLGTSILENTNMAGVTNSGIIEDFFALGKQDVGDIEAFVIRGTDPLAPSMFNFANSIKSIVTRGLALTDRDGVPLADVTGNESSIENVAIIAGRLGNFKPHASVSNLDLTVSGELNKIDIRGNVLNNSVFRALGPNGNIKSFNVSGDMDGDILVAGTLGKVDIGGDLSGDITVFGQGLVRGDALRSLKLGGALMEGSLNIHGDVGSITVAGDLGDPTNPLIEDQLVVSGDLGKLTVGSSRDNATLALDVIVAGDLKQVCVYGELTGDVKVTGDLATLKVLSDGTAPGDDAIGEDSITQVGGEIRSVQVSGGHIAGDINAGGDIGSVRLSDGDISATSEILSVFGGIKSVQISNGDLNGSIVATHGEIGSIRVSGSEMGASARVVASEMGSFSIDGSMDSDGLTGASIVIANAVRSLSIGGTVGELASIVVGSTRGLSIGVDLNGSVTVNGRNDRVSLEIGDNFRGSIDIAGEADVRIADDIIGGTINAGSDLRLSVGDSLLDARVFVDGSITDLSAASITDAVITAALDIARLSSGAVSETLIQAGLGRGAGSFGSGDLGESGRMGAIGDLRTGAMSNTIVAAGGQIDNVEVAGMTASTISSGLVVGGEAVGDVVDGTLEMSSEADRNAVRGSTGRQVFHGHIRNASLGLVSADSALTAGVDAGADGVFDGGNDDGIDISVMMTGGVSNIERVTRTGTSGLIIADGSIDLTGPGVTANLAAAGFIDRITVEQGSALEGIPTTLGDGGSGNSVTIDGLLFEISGPGSLDIHNAALGDGVVDSLVLRDTTSSTRITVTTLGVAGTTDIGRVITDANDTVGTFIFDGDIVGVGASAPDLWLDGSANTLSMRSMGDPDNVNDAALFQGRVGGDLNSLNIANQGPGTLWLGGAVNSLTLGGSFGSPLVAGGSGGLGDNVTALTIDGASGWAFDATTNTLQQFNPNTRAPIGAPVSVTPGFGGGTVAISHLDFDGAGLQAIANVLDLGPSVLVGAMSNDAISLRGLAVDSEGRIVAVENNGYLPSFDLGVDVNFVGTTVDANGDLFAVNDNGDDTYSLWKITRGANGVISSVETVGAGVDMIDGNADDGLIMTAALETIDGIAALEINSDTGELYVVGTTAATGGNQRLFSVDSTTAEATAIGDLFIVPAGARSLDVTPTVNGDLILDALLGGNSAASLGLANVALSGLTNTGINSASGVGTYTNTAHVYNIRDGMIISTGDVNDYEDGPNLLPANSTAYGQFGFGNPATVGQETLLDSITGGQFDHLDVTEITVTFDLLPGFDTIFFDLVWGTEEVPEFTGTALIDGFGVFVNGNNVALANGFPINFNHPDMAPVAGTELDGVIAPNGNPAIRIERFIGDGLTGNTITFIIADSIDGFFDSTAFIAGLGAVEPTLAGVTQQVTGLAFGEDPSAPGENALFATIRDGASDRLLKVALTPTDEDFTSPELDGVEEVAAIDLGIIQVNGADTNLQGIDFDTQGKLVGINDDATGDHRVLITPATPGTSRLYSAPGSDPDLLDGLTSNTDGTFFAIQNNSGSSDVLMSFNAVADRLVEVDPDTGAITVIGEIQDVFNNTLYGSVQSLAFTSSNTLLALVGDIDGTGTTHDFTTGAGLGKIDAFDGNGDGIVRISNPNTGNISFNNMPALRLDTDALTAGIQPLAEDFTSLAVNASGEIFASYDNGADDVLVRLGISSTTPLVATATEIGTLGAGGTEFVGLGFDASGNLFGLDVATGNGTIWNVNTAAAALTLVGEQNNVSGLLDAFAITTLGGVTRTFGYDFDSVTGGRFFASTGMSQTIGSVNSSGVFRYNHGLIETGANGLPQALSSAVTALATDAGTGFSYVATADGRLIRYSPTASPNADGFLSREFGHVLDRATGQQVEIGGMDFDGDGNLTGIDRRSGRLVRIDFNDATDDGVVFCEAISDGGTVGANFGALAFSPTGGGDGFFMAFDSHPDVQQVVALQGGPALGLGGIVANSINRLDITVGGDSTSYGGRIATIDNSIGSARITGDFTGSISTHGSIKSVQQIGAFSGTISAGDGGIGSVRLDGGVFSGAIETSGELSSFDHRNSVFSGRIAAADARRIMIRADVADGADIIVSGVLDTLDVSGTFDGRVEAGSGKRATIDGDLSATADITYIHGLDSLSIRGNTAAGSMIDIGNGFGIVVGDTDGDGEMDTMDAMAGGRTVAIGGTHAGSLIVSGSVNSMRFGALDGGIVIVGLDAGNVTIDNDMRNSLLAVGVNVGPDGVFNTADDQIFGGTLRSLRIGEDMIDSAVAAGVLPHESFGPGLPADRRAFIGVPNATIGANLAIIDSAEAGGIRESGIGRVDVRGNVLNTSPGAGLRNVLASAGPIDRIDGSGAADLISGTRIYTDPIGPPTVSDLELVNDSEFRIIFSEPVNTASIVLSQDVNNDGDLDDLNDVVGTITIRDQATGAILDDGDDIDLGYTTRAAANGQIEGVLKVRKLGGLGDGNLLINVSGDLGGNAVYDRSGLRSGLRDFNQDGDKALNEDPFGTILDGNRDGIEGGDASLFLSLADAAGSFIEALDMPELPVTVDGGTLTVRDSFESFSDIDVFRFTAAQFQFLAVDYIGATDAALAVFFQDTQGTEDVSDDTFELVSRYELQSASAIPTEFDNLASPRLFQAMELSDTGTYFAVVTPQGVTADADYELSITLASSDAALVNQLGGALPGTEVIGYVSNTVADGMGPNQNFLGFNDPRQIVFINFNGGPSQFVRAGLDVTAFDPGALDSGLVNVGDLLINGNTTGISGIFNNVVSIYGDTPSAHPLGAAGVTVLDDLADFAAYNAMNASGLFFTMIDPTLAIAAGILEADTPFTTVFVGATTDPFDAFLFGQASTVDFMNASKADEAIVFAPTFGGISSSTSLADKVNDYSRALANTLAHELGHTLGFIHHGDFFNGNALYPHTFFGQTNPDDIDNNPLTPDESNQGESLMGSGATADPTQRTAALRRMGTAPIISQEFPIGDIDHVDQLLKWLA